MVSSSFVYLFYLFFFSIRVLYHRHWQSTGQQGNWGDHLLLHSTTSNRSQTFKHLFAICIWDDYHVFLITTFVFTRLLLKEIYHLIELPFDWLIDGTMFVCLLDDLILIKNIINRITCWFSAWSWTAQNCRDSVLEILLHFIKYRNTQLISWCIDFVETRNFRRVSDESAKALQRFTQPEI